jgi:hypothetical protein
VQLFVCSWFVVPRSGVNIKGHISYDHPPDSDHQTQIHICSSDKESEEERKGKKERHQLSISTLKTIKATELIRSSDKNTNFKVSELLPHPYPASSHNKLTSLPRTARTNYLQPTFIHNTTTMLTTAPVNRTTLHPQGVKPHVPHSQVEEVISFPF